MPRRTVQLLPLSAHTPSALATATAELRRHLEATPDLSIDRLADAAFTLQTGRRELPHRRAVVCRDRETAIAALGAPELCVDGTAGSREPAIAFLFPGQGSQTPGMTAGLYDFSVERDHSHWRVQVASQSVFPAYKGSVWIEKKSGRVLRIEMETRNIPSEFPLDKVETAADYEYVRIGGVQQFLLPVHSETLSCQRGTNMCSRNAIDFRNYKKYSGEASITFEK